MTLVGIGYDSHRVVAGGRLVIGGVEIAADFGLEGHSDADVLIHAVIDALLGAAGMGDIGQHFPDTDERYRGVDSAELLKDVLKLLADNGYQPVNVDTTVAAEKPKLSPYREQIRQRLATLLQLPLKRVNLKATTGERIGFVGRGEGVAALAVASLQLEENTADAK